MHSMKISEMIADNYANTLNTKTKCVILLQYYKMKYFFAVVRMIFKTFHLTLKLEVFEHCKKKSVQELS